MTLFIITVIIIIVFEFIRSNSIFKTTRRTIAIKDLPDEMDSLKVVLISDLHEKIFGGDNSSLAQTILSLNPDLILFPGDMCDSYKGSWDVFLDLADKLGGEVPIFASAGNHDLRLGDGKKISEDMRKDLNGHGVIFLDNEHSYFSKNGKSLKIYGYCQSLDEELSEDLKHRPLCRCTAEALNLALGEKPNEPVILMAHDPGCFPEYAKWGADLTVSGHIHAGVCRLPIIGGVFSPDRIFFPKRDLGVYRKADKQICITGGLGGAKIPRFLNPAEICLITLRRYTAK